MWTSALEQNFPGIFSPFLLVSLFYRQIALKALSERLGKDNAKPWQQDRAKKHSPVPPAVSIPIPESTTPKPLASPLIPQVNVNIHNHPTST